MAFRPWRIPESTLLSSAGRWSRQRKHERDDGSAEAHSGADQLDNINRANGRQGGLPEHPEKVRHAESKKDYENPEESSPIIHDLSPRASARF
jgi:hypothetical protein